MIEGDWAGAGEGWRYDLLETRLQVYGETAVASSTFLLTRRVPGGLEHLTHNESRVLVRRDEAWKVVHVHKSPAWRSPIQGPPG